MAGAAPKEPKAPLPHLLHVNFARALSSRTLARTFRPWKRVIGPGRRLEDRIVHFFVVMLMAIQLASFCILRYAIEESAHRSLREELEVGVRVLDRLLLQQGRQLQEAASVISLDFGFREAVATRDRRTIASALENHAARFKASRMSLVDLDGTVVAESIASGAAGRRFPHPELMPPEGGAERGPAIRLIDGMPYQVAMVPVRAPFPVGWVATMLAIDDATARDLARLVNAGVAFVVEENKVTRMVATTLGEASRNALVAGLDSVVHAGPLGSRLEAPGSTYQTLARVLDETPSQRIHAVLLRATDEALASFRVLEVTALLIAGLSLALTLAGAFRIARRVVRPAFNQMERGLFERDLFRTRLGRVREQRDDLARMTQDLARQASDDPLTGLANRRTLDLYVAAWTAENRPIAAIMVDIDHFKEINDGYSHMVGDRVLRTVASLIRASVRPGDLAARYGGEEFLLAIPNADPVSVSALAERVRRVVETFPWRELKDDLRVTVSVGIAETRHGIAPAEVVRRADDALYAAKRAGRNTVRSHAPNEHRRVR